MAASFAVGTAHSIVPNENEDSETIVDTDGGVNGVGMFFTTQFGVCTGTLINPRTVIFAAHCVNDAPESAYGTSIGASFTFSVDAFPGVLEWFNNGNQTVADLHTFNVSQIQYNPASLARPAARGFLEGDVALATLDTPATGIPTWALMFSPLPAPENIDPVTGTGYHVNITGYGGTGNAFQGAVEGIDFRRRAAENMLGALGSLDQQSNALNAILGSPTNFNFFAQNLYFIDFDSPNRDVFIDLNEFRDDATPNEGATAGGDSGGPLILDAANNDGINEDLVLGVLSGGGASFNFGQPQNTYGESSFYQPLYLFADYIAAANPYRYVSALEGDGAWEDAAHWQSDLDPNYRIINESGEIVNGFPSEPSAGVNGTTPDFGQVCIDTAFFGIHGCQDLATGDLIDVTPAPPANGVAAGNPGQAASGANLQNNMGQVDMNTLANLSVDVNGSVENNLGQVDGAAFGLAVTGNSEAVSQSASGALPAPTLDNGLVGATDFVPNNIDPDIAAGVDGRYFDVTLSADGTTSVNSDIVIDRLTLSGAGAGLDITDGWSLFSLIDITQTAGTMNVDGAIGSSGDYLLMSGLLQGDGAIVTPFLTNVAGAIAPGDLESIGELSVLGSVVLSSGSSLFVNLSSNGVSDHFNILGDSSLGGNIFFAPDENVRVGNEYTLVTTAGTQTGEMTSSAISAILFADLEHDNNMVRAIVKAKPYSAVVDPQNAVQASYAAMMDGDRGAAGLADLFARMDLQSASGIQNIFNAWAPVTETTVRSLGKATMQNNSRFFQNRLSRLASGDMGGTMTTAGRAVQVAGLGNAGLQGVKYASADGQMETHDRSGLTSDAAFYMVGGYVDGSGTSMPGFQGQDDFDGWNVYMGADKKVTDNLVLGAGVNYSSLDADAPMGQSATSDHYGGTIYGQYQTASRITLDAQLGLGQYSSETRRVIGGQTLTTEADDMTYTAEIGLSRPFDAGGSTVSPGIRLRHNSIKFDSVIENGAPPALNLDRESYKSTQGMAGFDFISDTDNKVNVTFSGYVVKSLSDDNGSFQASFVGGSGTRAAFATFSEDDIWAEIGLGLSYQAGENVELILRGDTNMGRSDVKTKNVQAGFRARF